MQIRLYIKFGIFFVEDLSFLCYDLFINHKEGHRMKQQKRAIAGDKPGYTKTQFIEQVRKHGFALNTRQLTEFRRFGLIRGPQKRGKAGGGSEVLWPADQLPLLVTLLKQQDMWNRQAQHHLYRRAWLCTLPVWGWLYWGEEHTSVPLDQVKRALTTWAKAYQHSSFGQAKQEAKVLLQFVASPRATKEGKQDLKEELVKITYNGMPLQERKVDELRELLQHVIDPDNTGEVKGPKIAPLSAESVLQLINFRLMAINRLLGTSAIPDALWEWARACILFTRKHYQQIQPHLFSDSTLDASLRSMFVDNTTADQAMRACEDLLTMLGVALSEIPLPGLPALLQPQAWLAGEVGCSVQVTMKRSRLLLPNGNPYEYPSVEVTIKAR